MSKLHLLAAASALALGACAGRSAVPPAPGSARAFAAAARVEEQPAAMKPMSLAAAAIEAPAAEKPPARRRRGRSAPEAAVDAANREATREPTRGNYVNAAQVHPWTEGAIYRLYAAPERVSDIALQAGERLISVAAGDTARWVIGDTTSGAGAGSRTHILVKPSGIGLRTNLVIATDRRVYHVQLESTSRSAMASMSWTYPLDELLALKGAQAAAAAAAPVAEGIAVEELNFGYRISGDQPAWRPVRAFDDGNQVFIEFPPGLATGEAPPLFVDGARGGAELVNYRVRGRYYIVDRLFAAAELRLGERKQQVVRITRAAGPAQRRRRGRSS
jgi:P-type conjugative transfer protein TrbG